MADNDEEIARRRIYTQAHAVTSGTVPLFKTLVKKYLAFCQKVESPDAETEAAYTELLAALYGVQLHVRRQHAVGDALRREQELYASKQQLLLADIQQAERDIEARKAELELARQELKQNQEYEEVKQRVVRVPARSATRAEAAAVAAETEDLRRQGGAVEAALERRRTQLAVIQHAIEDVWRGMQGDAAHEDDEEEGALVGGGGGGGADAMQVG